MIAGGAVCNPHSELAGRKRWRDGRHIPANRLGPPRSQGYSRDEESSHDDGPAAETQTQAPRTA
jgi:hypothetical protein